MATATCETSQATATMAGHFWSETDEVKRKNSSSLQLTEVDRSWLCCFATAMLSSIKPCNEHQLFTIICPYVPSAYRLRKRQRRRPKDKKANPTVSIGWIALKCIRLCLMHRNNDVLTVWPPPCLQTWNDSWRLDMPFIPWNQRISTESMRLEIKAFGSLKRSRNLQACGFAQALTRSDCRIIKITLRSTYYGYKKWILNRIFTRFISFHLLVLNLQNACKHVHDFMQPPPTYFLSSDKLSSRQHFVQTVEHLNGILPWDRVSYTLQARLNGPRKRGPLTDSERGT